jgi:glycosyltransferase involved in cell wall biosynthesis
MKFRFSVVMPVHNREKYLRQAVDSVLAQTFTNYEFIAVDDGSTDTSLEILNSYGSRIKVVRQANQGPEVARNTGAALAQGEYLVMVDSDDVLLPQGLATYDRVARAFNSPPVILGSLLEFRDGQEIHPESVPSHPVKVHRYKDYLSKDSSFGVSVGGIVIRKSVFDEVGGFRNSTPQTFHVEDANLVLKVGTYGPFIVMRSPHTYMYRQHGDNSVRNPQAIVNGWFDILRRERRGEYPGGWARVLDRYAAIGGGCWFCAKRFCWKQGHRTLALQMVWKSAPMVCAAIWKKALRYFLNPARPILLRPESPLEVSASTTSLASAFKEGPDAVHHDLEEMKH